MHLIKYRSIRQLKKEVKAALLQRDITRNPTSGPAQTQSSESATTTDLAEEEVRRSDGLGYHKPTVI